jgi:hypothetical protein
MGLTWLYRLASEPTRLGPRYAKFNSLFLLYALEWFMMNHWLPGLLHKSWLLLPGFLAVVVMFLIWSVVHLPSSLPYIGLTIFAFAGAWFGVVLAMAASEQEEDKFAPSKKALNIAALLGVVGAILCLLLPPMIGFIAPSSRMTLTLISTALSFSASIYLFSLISAAAILKIIIK